jgi:hypothetical protein
MFLKKGGRKELRKEDALAFKEVCHATVYYLGR